MTRPRSIPRALRRRRPPEPELGPIKITVESVPSWLATVAPVCRAYMKHQLTRDEFFDRIELLRDSWPDRHAPS